MKIQVTHTHLEKAIASDNNSNDLRCENCIISQAISEALGRKVKTIKTWYTNQSDDGWTESAKALINVEVIMNLFDSRKWGELRTMLPYEIEIED